jgi:hypothetical protein
LTQSDSIVVPLVGAEPVTERRLFSLRGLVALIAVLGLTITLAGRVFEGSFYPGTSVYSGSAHQKVQHRDADGSRWVPPVATYVLLWTSARSPNIEPIEQIHFHPHYESLYNRPPPIN